MDDWLATMARKLGVDPLEDGQIAELLDVGRGGAHRGVGEV
jgi:hypothetical protein